MANVSEKTTQTSKPVAASKEVEKDSLHDSNSSQGTWASAPPMPPPDGNSNNAVSVQFKSNNTAPSFGRVIAQRSSLEEDELQMKADEDELQMKLDEDELQMKAEEDELQLKLDEDELQMKADEDELQMKLDEEELQMKTEPKADIPSFGKTIAQAKSNTGMPEKVQAKMEKSFGADFSDVKIHADSSKASDIGAQAFAQGNNIHMAPGKYSPNSQSGQELLGHELTHVVQQREGRVQATTQAKGIPVNDDAGLEKEADNFGAIAARGGIVQQKSTNSIGKGSFATQLKVAQFNPALAEPEAENGNEELEEEEPEQEFPIPPFPAYNPEEAEQAEVENRQAEAEANNEAPPIPPRPGLQPPQVQAPPVPARPQLRPPQGQAPPVPERPRMIKPKADEEVSRHSGAARTDYNEDGAREYAEYGILGSGVAASAASATTKGLQIGDTFGKGANVGDVATGTTAISEFGKTATAVSGLGVAAGGLGAIGAIADGTRAVDTMRDKDSTTGDRVAGGGGALISAGASGVKEAATSAYHASNLAGNAGAAAGAVAAAGIGSVVMGTADVARGAYGVHQAGKRSKALNQIEQGSTNKDVQSAAHQAASTQDIRKDHAKGTVVKGLLLVAGGTTLILLGSNPVGWGLLAGAAIVGGIASLRRFMANRKRTKDVAIRELGVAEEYAAFKAKVKAAKRKEAKRLKKEEDPLANALVARGYKGDEYGKFYADYIHDTAWVLYNCGVLGDQQYPVNQQMREVIVGMGMKVVDKKSPLPEKIAKSLNG